MILLRIYVDDILITRENQADILEVIKDLHAKFSLKTLGSINYFLGFEVTCSSFGLHLNQSKYARDLLHQNKYGCY